MQQHGHTERAVWPRSVYLSAQVLCVLLIAFCVAAPGVRVFRAVPGTASILLVVRLASGLCLAVIESLNSGRGRPRSRTFLAIGAVAVLVSFVDLGYMAQRWVRGELWAPSYREAYDLSAVRSRDIILVGDSFVWGAGVSTSQRFGNRLQALYADDGVDRKVYSLATPGAGLEQYRTHLAEVRAGARVDTVVMAFYMNDIELVRGPIGLSQTVSSLLGVSSPFLALAWSRLPAVFTVDDYHQYVVDSYRRESRDFARRWYALEAGLGTFRVAAAEHTSGAPLLLIQPIMVDFERYPLEEAHREVARAAANIGFAVYDYLPMFREKLRDGRRYRLALQDNHYNAYVHDLVARALKTYLDGGWSAPVVGDRAVSGTGLRVR